MSLMSNFFVQMAASQHAMAAYRSELQKLGYTFGEGADHDAVYAPPGADPKEAERVWHAVALKTTNIEGMAIVSPDVAKLVEDEWPAKG